LDEYRAGPIEADSSLEAALPYVNAALADMPDRPGAEVNAALGSRNARAIVEAVAQETLKRLHQQSQLATGLAPDPDTAAQGLALEVQNLLTASRPGWDDASAQRVTDEINTNPQLQWALQEAISTGEPARVATVMSGALASADARTNNANLDELATRMKLNAINATGASGRPDPISDDQARWNAIKEAGMGSYGERVR
jgi:hypothetical protein